MTYVSTPPYVFAHQADAVLNQANPTSGLKYTVLDTSNARIISIAVSVTFTAQPSPLEIHITVDGVPWTGTLTTPATATLYFMANTASGLAIFDLDATDFSAYRSFLFEGRRVKIEAETTGGTVQNLSARIKYAKIP